MVQEVKIEGQVNMQRLSSPCERLFFFPINVEFMRGGRCSGLMFEVGR